MHGHIFIWTVFVLFSASQARRQPALLRRRRPSRSPSSADKNPRDYFGWLFQPISTRTRVGQAAEDFSKAMLENGSINMTPLLMACQRFTSSMEAVGQGQSAREMRKNIQKIGKVPRNSDMKEFLRDEKNTNIHPYKSNGAILKDPSCAMGLLWVRRSLDFQCCLFFELLRGTSADEAVQRAYETTLEPYHGWALRKATKLTLSSNRTTRTEWLAKLGGFSPQSFGKQQLEQTEHDLQELLDVWKPLLAMWKQIFVELDIEDTRVV